MRIVLIHRYFWPDSPPYAHILRDIALALGERGHHVTVLTCQPSYGEGVTRAPSRERIAPTVDVRRFAVLRDRTSSLRKAANLVWFCLRLLASRRSLGEVDVVMAASTPPLAVARIGSILARRTRARFVYHKQDIYPEVVTAPGILRSRRWAALLRWFDARTDRRADRVIVLSEDMSDTVAARGVASDQVVVLNNFDPWDDAGPAPPGAEADVRRGDKLCVVFAGNLGRFQNLQTIVAAARKLGPDAPVELHFFGAGALADGIRREVASAGLAWVHFHGYRPPAEIALFLRTKADLGVVSLAPGVVRAAYPSKTLSYLRQGCPVLLLVEGDSVLVRSIEGAGAGFYAPPMDPEGLAEKLLELESDRPRLLLAREHAAAMYDERFARARQLPRWTGLFDTLGAAR